MGGQKETIPLKDADSARSLMRRSLKQNMINDLESDLGGGESSRSSWASDMRPITHAYHHSNTSDSGILLVESSVQTDSELLEMFMGLRRRIRSDSSNKSNEALTGNNTKVGATINVFNAYEKNNDGFESGESDYLLSSKFSDKTGSREPETPEILEHDVIESHRLLRPSKHSLFGTSGESSPLLGNGAEARCRISYDSTSEESLSDRDNHEFDELDDLLAGACPYEGSFGSIHKQTNEIERPLCSKNPHSKGPGLTSDTSRSVPSEYMGQVVLDLPSQAPQNRSGSLLPPDGPPDSFQSFLKSRGSVIPCVGTNNTQDTLAVGTSLRPTASAPMLVLPRGITGKNGNLLPVNPDIRAPPPGWTGQSPPSPNSDHCSGHSDYSIDEPKHISAFETTSPDSLSIETNGIFQLMPSDQAQHTLVGAVGGPSTSTMTPNSMPEKEDSISKFQEFLKTRGVDLDMSVVQSSDV